MNKNVLQLDPQITIISIKRLLLYIVINEGTKLAQTLDFNERKTNIINKTAFDNLVDGY